MHDGDIYGYLVNGEWRKSESGNTLKILTPYDESQCFEIQACTPAEIDAAFEAARSAQAKWAQTPLHAKAALLKRAGAFLRENKGVIADALVKEVAKGRRAAVAEVVRSAELLEYTAEEAVRVMGEGRLLLPDSFPGGSQ
ncbi:unnamed protein product, partial [Heterosigma akashiwo]